MRTEFQKEHLKEADNLGDLGVDVDNTKINLKDIENEGLDCIRLTYDMNQLWALEHDKEASGTLRRQEYSSRERQLIAMTTVSTRGVSFYCYVHQLSCLALLILKKY